MITGSHVGRGSDSNNKGYPHGDGRCWNMENILEAEWQKVADWLDMPVIEILNNPKGFI